MAGAIMNKVYDFLGIETANDEDIIENESENVYSYNYDKEIETEEEPEEKGFFGKKFGKVVSMPQPQQVKMVITQPTSFEQSEEITYMKKISIYDEIVVNPEIQ